MKPDTSQEIGQELRAIAEKIRAAYVETALTSYEDASANGLCAQGAWECAVDAMRHVEITELLKELSQPIDDQTSSRLPSGSRR
jgi:hypothetical protein